MVVARVVVSIRTEQQIVWKMCWQLTLATKSEKGLAQIGKKNLVCSLHDPHPIDPSAADPFSGYSSTPWWSSFDSRFGW